MLDLICVQFGIIISFILRFNFDFAELNNFRFNYVLGVTLVLNMLLFYTFKTYSGIIRHTNIEDTFRILIVNSIVSLLYIAVNLVTNQFFLLFPVSVVVINFFIINFLLISYRLVVRYGFKNYAVNKNPDRIKVKAVVFDTGEDGLHTKRVLNELPHGHIQVVAFMDDTLGSSGKLMEGLPIVGANDAGFQKLATDGIKLLIIANRNVSREKFNAIVDECLKFGIKVQQVPPIEEWLNGTLDKEQLKDIHIEDLLEREVIEINNESIYSEIKGKKILVTGAAGSIGSELVMQLLKYRPALIILCDKAESPLHDLQLEILEHTKNANIKPYIGNITDRVRMEHLFEIYNPHLVFHAAAYKHVPLMEDHPSIAVINNVMGTKILAELAVANGVEKFVLISTDKAVNPTNIMGTSKRIAEIFTQSYYKNLVRNFQLSNTKNEIHPTRFITTRFGNVLGSNGSVIPRFKKQLAKGGPITVTHPEITRFFMTIPEACLLVIEAGVMGKGGEIFVFDMGEPVKISDLAKRMIRLAGKEPGVDIQIVYTGLRPGEKLYEELLNDAENVMPTYHDKILIAKVREYDFDAVNDKIDLLIRGAQKHYTLETVVQMKELVPEYVSNNAVYEKNNAL